MIPFRYNLRSLVVRKATSIATALGIALVVFVLGAALMLSAGVRKTLAISGSPDVAIVLRKGSDAELSSTIESSAVQLIASAPGVKPASPSDPNAVGEIVVVGAMEKVGTEGVTNVQIRGVTDDVLAFRPDVQMVAGRKPQPGTDEVMIGQRIAGRFRGVDINQSFDLRKNRPVKVVGVFSDHGSSYESEVWAGLDALRSSYKREGYVSSVRVRLASASSFETFRTAIEGDKQYGFMALRETDYFEKQSEGTSKFINFLGTLISIFFSLGAMIGAMITMYAAVANRQREIGTLRALGFARRSILVAFLLESMALALAGGLIGTLAAACMGFVKFSMMNFASWSEIVFTFDPTPRVLLTALTFAAVMGLLGGLFPAIRASRVSPIQAIRA